MKKDFKKFLGKIVKLGWLDITFYTDVRLKQIEDDIRPMKRMLHRCYTYGKIIKSDDETIVISPEISNVVSETSKNADINVIPLSVVTDITILNEGKQHKI